TTGMRARRKARESNPHLREENRRSRAARPTVSGYLPKAMDRRRVELRFPPCDGGVVPLDQQPEVSCRPRLRPGHADLMRISWAPATPARTLARMRAEPTSTSS